MNVAITIFAVIIVVTGIYFSQRNFGKTDSQTKEDQEVLSEETTEDAAPTVAEETATPTNIPNTPTNTSTPAPVQTNLDGYRYPGSSVVSSSSSTLSLNSNDSPDKITDWYKEKIRREGMNVTSFVTTKTNDYVLNKLVGADGAKEVRVEITKDSGTNVVNISVMLN